MSGLRRQGSLTMEVLFTEIIVQPTILLTKEKKHFLPFTNDKAYMI